MFLLARTENLRLSDLLELNNTIRCFTIDKAGMNQELCQRHIPSRPAMAMPSVAETQQFMDDNKQRIVSKSTAGIDMRCIIESNVQLSQSLYSTQKWKQPLVGAMPRLAEKNQVSQKSARSCSVRTHYKLIKSVLPTTNAYNPKRLSNEIHTQAVNQ